MRRIWAGVVLMLAVVAPAAAQPAALETILLPVHIAGAPLQGANGSRWTTDLAIHNAGPAEVILGPCGVPSPLPSACPPSYFSVLAGETLRNHAVGFTDAGVNGRLLHVRAELASQLAFSLRVRDLARAAEDDGTELPVVRGEAFRTGTVRLIDVPLAPTSRVLLRVYDLDDRGDGQVRVRVISDDGAIADHPLLIAASGYGHPGGLPFAPGYGALPLEGSGNVRVEIEPITPGLRLWAFATVTNNATQHVTVVSPQ
ncbi:MAG TPA: hypothetical protein VFN10_18330 [Thermoanaerobaculia bacterium]|nr:hypothetical protein [Thermoanaerobaculia bacterium]